MKTTALAEPIQIANGEVSLVPLQPEWIPLAWEWLNQDRTANVDDYGPTTEQEFAGDLLRRVQSGQTVIGLLRNNAPVGIVAIHKINERLAQFAGLCIARNAQRQQVGTIAVGMLLLALWQEGYEKIEAHFFADNKAVAGLFQKLGAHDEGLLREHTVRDGKPVDVKLMGFCRNKGF